MASLDRGHAREGSVYTTPSNDMDEFDIGSRRGTSRGPWLGIIAAVIFVAFSATAYVIYRLGMERGMRESPPIVAAQDDPVRVRPDEPGGLSPPPEREIYDVASGEAQTREPVEQLLPREDEGIDLDRPAGAQAESAPGPLGADEDAPPSLRTDPTPPPAAVAAVTDARGPTDSIVIPKPTAALAKAEPAAPPAPAAEPAKSAQVDLPKEPPPKAAPPPAAKAPTPPKEAVPPPVKSAAAPAPAPAPETPKPAPAPAAKVSGYLVQVGAFFDDSLARDAWKDLQTKHAPILGDEPFDIARVDLGTKGVWYRLRVGPYEGKAEADALCAKLKARGQDCLVRKE